jgi:hypothetical protein
MKNEITRQAFRRAAGDAVPDASKLVDAVPEIMHEARRRQALARPVDPISAIIPLARRAIPAMATAAVLLAVVASIVGMRDSGGTADQTTGLDALILTGQVNGEVSDVLLEALTDVENDNG